jgi:antitoxin VapB
MAASSKPRTRAPARAPSKSVPLPPAPARAKLFANGRSQAVRLPKEFRLPGTEVLVRRDGHRLILEPIDASGWPVGFRARLDALLEGLDWDWERPPDPVPPPIEEERDLP